jgi:hypothetical protein
MSDSVTLEFKSSLEEEEIASTISEHWTGFGYYVHVYTYPHILGKVFCTLDYFGYREEREMLIGVLKYIRKISLDGKIYYYRCADFVPITKPSIPVLEISVDDLFSPDFSPSLSASIETKYLLSSDSINAL